MNDVEFNVVSSYQGGKAVLNAVNASDLDIGWVAGPQKSGVASGDLVNLANGEDKPLMVSPDAQPLSDIGVDFHFGATFVAIAPAGLPDEVKTALSDAISTVVLKEGTKSNAFISKALTIKVMTGDEVQAYVEGEEQDAKALLNATAD